MKIEEEVKELIDLHSEGEYLDFKEMDYHKDNKEELVKDVLSLANSHSDRDKYIIIGVEEENNVCKKIKGLDKSKVRDEAEFQQIINNYISDDLKVNYKVLNINGKDILVIQIFSKNNANRPFMVKKQIGKLKENEIYIRKGSTTSLASKKDLEYMFKNDKKSKLAVYSYLNGNISNKLLLDNIKKVVKEYKEKKFEKLKQLVEEINKLKDDKYVFEKEASILVEDEVKLEEEKVKAIKKGLKQLKIPYERDIFTFDNIGWKLEAGGGLIPLKKILYGDQKEIERYWKLEKLDVLILEYMAISIYFEHLPEIYSTSLFLTNTGDFVDEDIELKLIVDKDSFCRINKLIIDDDTATKYLGNMYNDLKYELTECPRISDINQYEYPLNSVNDNITSNIPKYINSMYHYEKTYLDEISEKTDEFKTYINSLYDDSLYEENGNIILIEKFDKIMHNKSMFIESKLLFNSNNIVVKYEIRSKNNSKVIEGIIRT